MRSENTKDQPCRCSCHCLTQTRRDFIKNSSLIAAAAGFAAYSVFGQENDAESEDKKHIVTVDLSQKENKTLQQPGNAIFVDNPVDKDRPIIIYRKTKDTFSAFSSRCTHKGGPLLIAKDGTMVCQWHKAVFDTNGNVIKGPAKKELTEYSVEFYDETIKIIVL